MIKKILFLCTQNSARSQMAEAIVNSKAKDKFLAYSAGSNPADKINPYAVAVMEEIGIDMSNRKPKSVMNFIDEEYDFIITLCDKMKDECPRVTNDAIHVHWGISDPKDFQGNDEDKKTYFKKIRNELNRRIELLIALPLDKIEKAAVKQKLEDIIKDL